MPTYSGANFLEVAVRAGCTPVPEFASACSKWLANAMDTVPSQCPNACYKALLATGKRQGCEQENERAAMFHLWTKQCKATMTTLVPTVVPTEVPTTQSPSPSPSHTPTESPTTSPSRLPTQNPTTRHDATCKERFAARLATLRGSNVDVTKLQSLYGEFAECLKKEDCPSCDCPAPTEPPTVANSPTEPPTAVPTRTPTEDPTIAPTPCNESTATPTETPTILPTYTLLECSVAHALPTHNVCLT